MISPWALPGPLKQPLPVPAWLVPSSSGVGPPLLQDCFKVRTFRKPCQSLSSWAPHIPGDICQLSQESQITSSAFSLYSAPSQSSSHINLLIISPHSHCIIFLFLLSSNSSSLCIFLWSTITHFLQSLVPTFFIHTANLFRVNISVETYDGITFLT